MKWLNKYEVFDENDVSALERSAAVNQFHHSLSKSDSEQLAYNSWRRIELAKSAAYHLDGMSFAKTRADKDAEQKHYAIYSLCLSELGYDPRSYIPPEVTAHRGEKEPSEMFKSYRGDLLALKKPN